MPSRIPARLDDIDLFLLRVGMDEDGALADEEPFTDRGEDIRDRCEGLVALGLLKFVGTDRASGDQRCVRCPECGDFSTQAAGELCDDCLVVTALVEKFGC